MFVCVILAISLGKFTLCFRYIIYISIIRTQKLAFHFKQDFSFYSIGMVSATPKIYTPKGLPWGGLCDTGMMQSPIDLKSSPATVHAPIQFRNFFNGHFNKVGRL